MLHFNRKLSMPAKDIVIYNCEITWAQSRWNLFDEMLIKNINRVEIAAKVEPILVSMRAELDDHLMSINENTDELNQNFACFEVMNQKIDALAQRVDKLSLFLRGLNQPVIEEKKYELGPLTKKEKAVFWKK